MTWSLGIALYFVVWWIVLFAVLPFGVRTQAEDGAVVPGTPASAPRSFSPLRVVKINTVVATLVFGLIWVVIELDVFGIGEMAAAVNR